MSTKSSSATQSISSCTLPQDNSVRKDPAQGQGSGRGKNNRGEGNSAGSSSRGRGRGRGIAARSKSKGKGKEKEDGTRGGKKKGPRLGAYGSVEQIVFDTNLNKD